MSANQNERRKIMMKQKVTGRRFIAFLLMTALICSTCAIAYAEEPGGSNTAGSAACEMTDGCELESGHEGDCRVPSADGETSQHPADDGNTPGDGAGTDSSDQASDSVTELQEENKERTINSSGLDNIYPGREETLDGTTVWVAYDAPYSADQPAAATVKATVTLPDGVTVPEGYKLFIRRMKEGEAFYPTADAVKARASKYNGYQCYMIRWVKVDSLGMPVVPAETQSMSDILKSSDSKNVTIKIDYLKEDTTRLEGQAGARKLLVFNSTREGELLKTVSDSVTDVAATDTHYKSFTFSTHQAGPYVFVSKTLSKGFIERLVIQEIIDGFDPLDKPVLSEDSTPKEDAPGNDSGYQNRIVRSYDSIQYTLGANIRGRNITTTEKSINVYFELSLKKSATAARFDTSKMNWLGENYDIEYLDEHGKVIMIQTHKGELCRPETNPDGTVKRDEHGFAHGDENQKVSMNGQLNGSKSDKESYKVAHGGVVEQKLTGYTTVTDETNVLSGTQSFKAAVEVRNADNGEIFQPTFRMWVEGNEDNYGEEGSQGDEMIPAQLCEANIVSPERNNIEPVKVSAGTNFNVRLKKNTDMSYKNWFNFSTGEAVEVETQKKLDELANLEKNHGKSNPAEFVDENGNALDEQTKKEYGNYRYGRITCYGITLQLYNDTNNDPDKNRASKGFKGLSLPVGDIEFDLNFSSTVLSQGQEFEGSKTEYPAILWDYNENVPAQTSFSYEYSDPERGEVTTPSDGRGNGGRRFFWDGEERSSFAKGGAPSNYLAYFDGCYYGGDWALMNGAEKVDSRDKLSKVAHPDKVTGTGGDAIYHFSVSDYDFDFDNQHFPYRDAGNSGNVTGFDTYAHCFSAGCVQVLNVFPRVQKEDNANIDLTATVSNLKLQTRAGQELKALTGDDTKFRHEVNTSDNKSTDGIVVYAPGHLTKGNAFNGQYKDKEGKFHDPTTTSTGFLGTEYWTTSYDCSTFAGDEIWIMSYGMMGSGSDFHTKSMNLLQIFDSRALSIRGKPDVNQELAVGNTPGTVKFLYAADPDYPGGYDTNRKDIDMVKYMNTVREEDLVYSEEIDMQTGMITVNNEEMKCIGVLMEIRDCDLLGGKYQYLRIPVKVNGEDEDLVGKTVATVNSFRTWSYNVGKDITWSNGEWNEQDGKNVLENYPVPGHDDNKTKYSGELSNEAGKLIYTKTEYKNGQKDPNSHGGGTLAGNSLLILGYKAHINIGVDGKGDSGSNIYNLDNNETVVDYRLRNIKTEISALTGQENPPRTKLEVRAVLDEENDTGKDRISIASGTYKMEGKTISNDSGHPTSVTFTSDGKEYTIEVYAQMGTTSREVTFVINNAPVGVQLPDITFQANFASVKNLKDNAAIKTSTYISGTGDNRAYSKTNGNADNVTVNIVLRGGTNLNKEVTEKYIELNGRINYDITYTNSGSSTINKVYFYDLLPYTEDIRDSKFDGDVILRTFGASSSEDPSDAPTATVYYSTTEYPELYAEVSKFGGETDVEGRNEQGVEDLLDGTTKNKAGESFFEVLGEVKQNTFTPDADLPKGEELNVLMQKITGLYVKAEHVKNNQTVTLSFGIDTNENNASNLYRNISNSWVAGDQLLPLKSTRVETAVVSRRISGVVWYDWNLNGIRDVESRSREGQGKEKLLEGVTATLFKKNETSGKYEKCTEDVTGQVISPVTTEADGAYSFDRLAQGDYIVAFSGEALKSYTDATFYQQNGKNDASTSDGEKISELKAEGIDKDIYPYFIKYSAGSDADSESIKLHSIDDIRGGKVALNNYREDISHQDLGLITAGYELPETGGTGTVPYTVGGILLIIAAFSIWGFAGRRRQYR